MQMLEKTLRQIMLYLNICKHYWNITKKVQLKRFRKKKTLQDDVNIKSISILLT